MLQKLMMKSEQKIISLANFMNPETSCVFGVVYSNYIVIFFSFFLEGKE